MPDTETITSIQEPWEPQQPHLQNVFGQAEYLHGTGGPQYFPGQTVAPFSGQTQGALDRYEALAGAGSPQAAPLQDMMAGTLRGDYLNSNPYLDAMMDAASRGITRNYQEAVAPSIGASFDSAGRYGSGLYQNMQASARDDLSRSLGETASNLYGQNYASERDNQIRAAALAPSTMPLQYYDASQMLNVGNVYDQQAQRNIAADYDRYNFEQNRPWDALGRYGSLVQGGYGGSGSVTSPLYNSPLSNVLGGASLGSALGGQFGPGFGLSQGQGSAVGGALGGLGGYIFGS
jgi:hypothetical protein